VGSSPASPVMLIKKARSKGSTRHKFGFALFGSSDQLIANTQPICDCLLLFARTSESEAVKKGLGPNAEPLIDKILRGTIVILCGFVFCL
jgi:hypothetical protein